MSGQKLSSNGEPEPPNSGDQVGHYSDQQHIDKEAQKEELKILHNKLSHKGPLTSSSTTTTTTTTTTTDAQCERLLRNTKKQVKQMMEEAVTKKFIHEESSSLISLCVAVDACLTHNLKRRALGLFKTNSSTALIQKLAKTHKDAQEVLDLVSEQEQQRQRLTKQTSARAESASDRQVANCKSPLRQMASNSNVIRRNMWIKCALIEKKLVSIVDHLAKNANKYYEPDALLSNYLCAQILSSLLVGPSALEFSRSKTSDCYQFEEPTAEELMKRHKLANPIACLCSNSNSNLYSSSQRQQQVPFKSTGGNSSHRERCATISSSAPTRSLVRNDRRSQDVSGAGEQTSGFRKHSNSESRRRPLALKTSFKRGTLVTDCHHYSCQEFSEHQATKGYSFLCNLSSGSINKAATGCSGSVPVGSAKTNNTLTASNSNSLNNQSANQTQQQQDNWSVWSPRMLHETLHQNSKSNLLYAKNNVLLETQPGQTVAGYLSLHQQGKADLILKWIPNQMINGSQGSSTHTNGPNSSTISPTTCDPKPLPERGQATEGDIITEKDSTNITTTESGLSANQNSLVIGQQVALESSYLDLVVSLPVSRIVLLHCQFGKREQRTEATTCQSPVLQENKTELIDGENGLQSATMDNQVEELDSTPSPRVPSTEDTLILIETDGVQRSPFKFPKGALRVFLSCLESGLRPNKYLDSAINFDNTNLFDPLVDSTPLRSPLCTKSSDGSLTSEPPSAANSEPTSSRLDNFLKRLPSLKRKSARTADLSSCLDDLSRVGETGSSSEQVPVISNYVYRIVSSSQPDWVALPTPPHSAMSVGSYVTNQHSKQQPSTFRWSLSRLAKFSNRYTNSGSTSSSSVLGNSTSLNANDSLSSNLTGGNIESSSTGDQTNQDLSSLTQHTMCPLTNRGALNTGDSLDDESPGQTDKSRDLVRIEAKLHDLKQSTSGEVLHALRTQSVQTLCESMRRQILARAFYGWLAYCRKTRIIRRHLINLIKKDKDFMLIEESEDKVDREKLDAGLTRTGWQQLMEERDKLDEQELIRQVNQLVYYGGIECNELRREVWPYLLEHYKFTDDDEAKHLKDKTVKEAYEACWRDWIKIERVVKQRDHEILAANIAKASNSLKEKSPVVAEDGGSESNGNQHVDTNNNKDSTAQSQDQQLDSLQEHPSNDSQVESEETNEPQSERDEPVENEHTKVESSLSRTAKTRKSQKDVQMAAKRRRRRARLESTGSVGSDASITDQFGNNIHRIDKDVQRCDRSFWYFKDTNNLNKLRNIMCSYVWQHLDVGYVQGMCDLAAPFLVVFDDELLAFSCFSQLMKRMVANFPHGCAMDEHFESLKHLMQVLDPKLFEVLQSNGDYTHFYFCYRWLLLDFKRELAYEDVYRVWETIWSARHLATDNFVVFMALAMVRYYRDIIIENNMDFTDTIKFFNEMAERHDAKRITTLARDCIVELRTLIRNQSK